MRPRFPEGTGSVWGPATPGRRRGSSLEVIVDRTGSAALARARTHVVGLPDGRVTTVWDVPGPAGAPTLVLLHGVTLTARLNWGGVIEALSGSYRVLLHDLRGHGDGAPAHPFRLEACADDVAAIAGQLGLSEVVPVGYSMGGLVAQLVWRRHPSLVSGLVLCSTTRNTSGALWEQSAAMAMPGMLTAAALLSPMYSLGADVVGTALLDHDTDPHDRRWAQSEMRRTSLVDALAAMNAVCEFSSHSWVGSVDVPTAVLITRHDRVVPPRRQWKLANAVPGSTVFEIDGGHDVFLTSPGRFGTALDAACSTVCGRVAPASALGA
jgi:3-oxoadipate enol-lactonase